MLFRQFSKLGARVLYAGTALTMAALLPASMVCSSAQAAPGSVSSEAQFAPAPQTISSVAGIYLEASMAGVRSNYSDLYPGLKDWDNGNWQFAAGTDLGYRLDQFFAAEIGYNYFLPAEAKNASSKIKFNAMTFYGAGKFIVPLTSGFEGFAKFGISYSKLNTKGSLPANERYPSHWGPVFGVGMQYAFNDRLSVSANYTRYPGLTNVGTTTSAMIPAFNVVGLTFGYHFFI